MDFATKAEREARKKEADALEARIAPLKKQIADLDTPYREKIGEAKRTSLEPKYREALAVPAEKRSAQDRRSSRPRPPS